MPQGYLDQVMHDPPAAGALSAGHRSDAHVGMHQGPLEPRAGPAHPAQQHVHGQHLQQQQQRQQAALPNGSAVRQEARAPAASTGNGSGATVHQQPPACAPAAAPQKKADDSGTGDFLDICIVLQSPPDLPLFLVGKHTHASLGCC